MNQSGWKVAAVTVVEEIVGVAERDTKPVCLYMWFSTAEKSGKVISKPKKLKVQE